MDKQFKNRQFVSWCKRLIRVSLFSLYAAVAFDTNSSIAAPTGKLEDWRFSPQGSQLEISLSAQSRPRYFYLSQPPRIVIDLPDTKLGYVPTQQDYDGAIQRIRVSQLKEDVTRIVMDLAPGAFFDRNQVQLQPDSWEKPTRWVFRPLIAGNGNFLSQGYPSVGGELPPGAGGQLPPGDGSQLPPGAGSQLPPGAYPPSQLPNNSPYTPQPPGILSTPQQPPGSLPPVMYNPSQLPPGVSTQPSSFTAPLPPTPINNGNIGQPTVSVPPITRGNISPQIQNTVLPPATFPSPSGNLNSPPSFFPASPSKLPTITTPNNSVNSSDSGVIEFGQPFLAPNQ